MRHFALVIVGCSFLWLAGCANAPEDVGAATYNVCCGANCCCPGIGTGGPISTGDLNPANMCERCDPATNPNAWTPIPGCTAGGDDAGPGMMMGTDAGTGGGGGGGCSVGARAPAGGAFALLGVVALALWRRRRA